MLVHASELQEILDQARAFAKREFRSTVSTVHVLHALTETDRGSLLFAECGIDINILRSQIAMSESEGVRSHAFIPDRTRLAESVRNIVRSAKQHADKRGMMVPQERDVLLAILDEPRSAASQLLKRIGVTRASLPLFFDQPFSRPLGLEAKISFDEAREIALTEQMQESDNSLVGEGTPHQTMAPVRVEQVDGRLALLTDRGSAIDADERDFDRWRAPVAARLSELLDDDLGSGTNHSRLRKRLLDLAAALAGKIDDVKENQFQLGYGIEALGRLVVVYRDAADDMPTLNAAVFTDVDHLHIQLMLGLSKLVAWSRFQREADADELHEGAADPAAVGAALAEAEAVLAGEAARPIVDPELPRSFRWIREAIADPKVVTKRMVYGAVKSLENVGSFLGQLTLRTAKEVIENTAQGISKRAAAVLLLALSPALLHLSGALPTALPWLRPLLEAAAKVVGG